MVGKPLHHRKEKGTSMSVSVNSDVRIRDRLLNNPIRYILGFLVLNLLGFVLGASVPYPALCLGIAWVAGIVGALLYRWWQTTGAKKPSSFIHYLGLWTLSTATFTPGCLLGAALRLWSD